MEICKKSFVKIKKKFKPNPKPSILQMYYTPWKQIVLPRCTIMHNYNQTL